MIIAVVLMIGVVYLVLDWRLRRIEDALFSPKAPSGLAPLADLQCDVCGEVHQGVYPH